MALNEWRWLYADRNFIPQGELLNLRDRTLSLALSKIDTCSFSMRTDHYLSDALLSLEGFLKVYRNNTLLFYGPLVDATETVDEGGGRISFNAASQAWALQYRFPAKTVSGNTFPAGTDRAIIVSNMLSAALETQYDDVTNPWITPDDFRRRGSTFYKGTTLPYPISSAATLAAVYKIPTYTSFMTMVTELASGLGGFDWRFMPFDNFVNGAVTDYEIMALWAAPTIGTARPEAIFEFGDGRLNMKSYTRTRSRQTQANVVTHLLSNEPEANPPMKINTTSTSKWGVMEDLAQVGDLTDPTLRQQLVDEHVNIRMEPRHTIVFDPTPDYGSGRLPRFGVDYNVGDTITARAVSQGKQRFNAQFRVWGIEFTIDESGVETPKLTLSEQGT